MFYLGLLLPICYLAGFTGAAIPTQWPFLSLALAPVLWRSISLGPLHWLGLLFLAYATLAAARTNVIFDALWGLWQITIWALAFWLGSSLTSLRRLWQGLAIGLTISTIVAIGQWLDYNPVYTQPGNLAGLLYNQTVAGAAIALCILGLISERLWLYIPALLPGVWLAHSRGAWLILTVGLCARLGWYFTILPILGAGLYYTNYINPDDALRLQLWQVAHAGLTFFGHGPGSFLEVYYRTPDALIHPEFVHNDYIQLWFEFGLGAIPVFILLAFALTQTSAPAWPILIAWCTLALFYFPLYCPITAFLGALVAGHICRDVSWASFSLHRRRSVLIPRYSRTRRLPPSGWRGVIPTQQRT